MQLSPNFTLDEFVNSPRGKELGIDNTPEDIDIDNLKALCINVLEPLRSKLNEGNRGKTKHIFITSGYRCPELNKAVGGSKNSQHMIGCAADTHVDGMTVQQWYDFVKASGVKFDQEIQEFNEWVHISYDSTPRGEKLIATKENGHTVYSEDLT